MALSHLVSKARGKCRRCGVIYKHLGFPVFLPSDSNFLRWCVEHIVSQGMVCDQDVCLAAGSGWCTAPAQPLNLLNILQIAISKGSEIVNNGWMVSPNKEPRLF